MSNQLHYLLSEWAKQPDEVDWVLGTIYRTEGPAYRKAGAMMLFNSLGQQWGMLSGGCLETDIQTHARRVMQTGEATQLCYDGSDEDDLSFQLGIGCGGTVYIVLQAIHAENHYLQLDRLYAALQARKNGIYRQNISAPDQESYFTVLESRPENSIPSSVDEVTTQLLTEGDNQYLQNVIQPQPHLLIIGGGVDARPLVGLAHQLGWQTSLWDPRPANARREYFMQADHILDIPSHALAEYVEGNRVDAAVLMSHHLELDAQALKDLNGQNLSYWALLGPNNRRQRVLNQAQLLESQLQPRLAGPAGLDIGAELPESIALSILTECHAVLKSASGRSLSGYL